MNIIEDIKISAYKIPTDHPEADGTLEWNSTTLILVELNGAGRKGIGYTYANIATAYFIKDVLQEIVVGKDLLQISYLNQLMINAIRNNGNCGIAMMAVSAVDSALWDLKSKVMNLPLCELLGKQRDEIMIYRSGGFTSYSNEQLQGQLEKWVREGVRHIKMKIGSIISEDVKRIKFARKIIGETIALFVDANGAYTAKQAIEKAKEFSDYNVTWFEEPVRSDNLKGLRFVRDTVTPAINIAAGEYGYNLSDFEEMLDHEAVDILQADATRCGGISGFLKACYLSEAKQIPFSSHCATALHLHAALALPSFYIAEHFHDHARIEEMLFDGVQNPENGLIKPDLSRPGLGIEFKHRDAEKYKVV
jgi:L-alanine-DL-glutamate epimerase-like enolase superfamily enzyme